VHTRGSSRICEGRGMNVEIVPSRTPSTPSGSSRKCSVNNVRRLTPDEAAALPANARP
jgi:hypothetical protein